MSRVAKPGENPSLGLPLWCAKCPPKHYYGVLKAETVPSSQVKYTSSDICPNCKTPLGRSARDPDDSSS